MFLLGWIWRAACCPRSEAGSDSGSSLTAGATGFAPWAFAGSLHTARVFLLFFSIQITCYDKNGNIVKRVTSADDGTVEDETRAGSTDTSSDTSGSGTSSGGSSSDDDLGGGMV